MASTIEAPPFDGRKPADTAFPCSVGACRFAKSNLAGAREVAPPPPSVRQICVSQGIAATWLKATGF